MKQQEGLQGSLAVSLLTGPVLPGGGHLLLQMGREHQLHMSAPPNLWDDVGNPSIGKAASASSASACC